MVTTIIPHFRKTAQSQQLIVDGEPFLILGGEVQNSQFSSASYMKNVWSNLKAGNLNTVFGSVSWEQIEPCEGKFCFDELDEIILDARAHDLRLVLLWFGSFKNGLSTYTPSWVKLDTRRFPRAELNRETGERIVGDLVSIFGPHAAAADAKAFAALMSHIREVDATNSTVIMVQVENEVGLLGDSRDRSAIAEAAWNQAIPSPLLDSIRQDWDSMNNTFKRNFEVLKLSKNAQVMTWDDIPGRKDLTEELFMAYHYALYTNKVAAAGKAVYALPMFTNVWQNYSEDSEDGDAPTVVAGGGKPGDYPCGGAVTNVLDIWKMFAPALDLIAPDIYLNDYPNSCAAYRHRSNTLLIPEQRRDDYGARRIWSAFGSYQCIGTAPFGIDTSPMDSNPFIRHYGLLKAISRQVLQAQADGNRMAGFFFDELPADGCDPCPTRNLSFGSWKLTVERSFVFGRPAPGYGIIIHMERNKFLLVGEGFQVRFASTEPGATFSGILCFEEKQYDHSTGALRTLRLFNGDETRSGMVAIMPSEEPDYGGFPISITIPANTRIAECEPYIVKNNSSLCN